VESDAKHEQDDADLGEFIGDALIGYKARREGAGGGAIPASARLRADKLIKAGLK
jgi:hypothetical protein